MWQLSCELCRTEPLRHNFSYILVSICINMTRDWQKARISSLTDQYYQQEVEECNHAFDSHLKQKGSFDLCICSWVFDLWGLHIKPKRDVNLKVRAPAGWFHPLADWSSVVVSALDQSASLQLDCRTFSNFSQSPRLPTREISCTKVVFIHQIVKCHWFAHFCNYE